MTTINFGKREILCKLVYYGCGLCGKTTNLVSLHGALNDEMRGDLLQLATETERTIFFDMMPLELGEIEGFKIRFSLYTVPGQVQYIQSRKSILSGVDGIVFVADSQSNKFLSNLESMQDLKTNLAEYNMSLETLPWVIQYNKRDIPGALPVSVLEGELNPLGAPSFEAVASTGIGVNETLRGLSHLVLESFNR
ncbi:MAG TPA: gliding-motility protein MglA [Cyanobacteria bacterium UBA8530]|nr:gliding-motility protein MglA [Cyanobacteria bacterium UBA8530]